MKSIAKWCEDIHELAKKKGWWSAPYREFPEIAALIHSEVSEAFEEWRSNLTSRYNPEEKPEGLEFELADIVIRIMDYCRWANIDLEMAMEIKHEYNKGRPYRHGDKKA